MPNLGKYVPINASFSVGLIWMSVPTDIPFSVATVSSRVNLISSIFAVYSYHFLHTHFQLCQCCFFLPLAMNFSLWPSIVSDEPEQSECSNTVQTKHGKSDLVPSESKLKSLIFFGMRLHSPGFPTPVNDLPGLIWSLINSMPRGQWGARVSSILVSSMAAALVIPRPNATKGRI